MKSLRELTNDLTLIRLQATNVSIWTIQSTLTERARRAINDGIAKYEMHVENVYYSIGITGGQQVIALPDDIQHIIRIEAIGLSGWERAQIRQYDQVVTPFTNLLYIKGQQWPNDINLGRISRNAEIIYETRQPELPPDVMLMGNSMTAINTKSVFITGGSPGSVWPDQGYIELSVPWVTTDQREVIRYAGTTNNAFVNLTRGAEDSVPSAWTQGAVVSSILAINNRGVPVIMESAQATMYEFWVRNRALYDQYTAIASEQAMSVQDLIALSAAHEAKADKAFSRIKEAPKPTTARVRRRRP